MPTRPTVAVIMGSVRAQRRCGQITAWVAGLGEGRAAYSLEIVDLADWPLPMDDEPGIPALGEYASPATRAWSAKIAGLDGFVFVTPQYNWGYPAALKNALDHLYREWHGKPAAIVSYGGHGGGKSAAQLTQVAGALKMRLAATMPALELSEAIIRGGPFDPARDLATHADSVRKAFDEMAALLSG